MNYGNNLKDAKAAANANAVTFGITYYVVQTTIGLCVEREKPADETLIVYTTKHNG